MRHITPAVMSQHREYDVSRGENPARREGFKARRGFRGEGRKEGWKEGRAVGREDTSWTQEMSGRVMGHHVTFDYGLQ